MNDAPKKIAWFYRPVFVILLLSTLGPFALPWLWKSPAFRPSHKIILTVLTGAITIWLVVLTADTVKAVTGYLKALQMM